MCRVTVAITKDEEQLTKNDSQCECCLKPKVVSLLVGHCHFGGHIRNSTKPLSIDLIADLPNIDLEEGRGKKNPRK